MAAGARSQILAACLGVALALFGASPARADTATGVDTALGNALNPPGQTTVPRPLSQEDIDTVRRSPTGQLYQIPYDRSEGIQTDGGWNFNGSASAGLIYADGAKNALFQKYKDVTTGFYLSNFQAEIEKAPGAYYFQATGGGVGYKDQYYGVQFGRYNDWKLKLFYNETPHVYTTTYKSLYDGTGTNKLTLAGGLKPNGGAMPVTTGTYKAGDPNYVGSNATNTACSAQAPCWRYTGPDGVTRIFSNAAAAAGINWIGSAAGAPQPVSDNSIAGSINTYLNTVPGNTELGIVRRKGGIQAEGRLAEHWKAYASATAERRNGARPFSMNENNYTVEIPEPIDYTTFDALAGLTYADPVMQANLRASASVFRNSINTLTVDQPWLAAATGLGAAQTTIFDLYPNNSAFNVKGEFARTLPFWKTRLAANVGWGTSLQDDHLLNPMDTTQSDQIAAAMGSTVIRGVNNPGYATNTLDLNNWNGVNGSPLSRTTAHQRIDATLANVGLTMKPASILDIKADFRYRGTLNKGGYTAYNPLTGQFGRGFRNSTGFDLVVGSAGDPGATGVPCYAPAGSAAPSGCTFNGNAGVTGQSTNNPANIPVFSPPRDVKQLNYVRAAILDLGKAGSINVTGDHERIYRSYRERAVTWENKVKAGYVTRGLDWATLRVSYEGGWRLGTPYEFWPTGDFGTGLPGLDWDTIVKQYFTATPGQGWTVPVVPPATAVTGLQGYLARYAIGSRKFDLADRNQNVVNARLNLMPTSDLDVALAFQYKDVVYPQSIYGLQNDQVTTLSGEVGYQPFTHLQINAFYSWQKTDRPQRGNAGTNAQGANNACTWPAGTVLTTKEAVDQCAQQIWLDGSTAAGDSSWHVKSHDQNHVGGVSLQTALGPVRLGVDYKLSFSRSTVTTDYGANVLTTRQAELAGALLPNINLTQHTVTAHLLIALHKRIGLHFFYVHETGFISDYHYSDVPIGASAAENNATVMLDAGPQSYHTNVVGALVQFKL
jgi:hypothetical protein